MPPLMASVCVCYLAGAVAAESLQVLPVSEVTRQPAVLQRDAGVNEGGRAAVVVHKERLGHRKTLGGRCTVSAVLIQRGFESSRTFHCCSLVSPSDHCPWTCLRPSVPHTTSSSATHLLLHLQGRLIVGRFDMCT